jgi:methionine-rich copper-binding protein CopC
MHSRLHRLATACSTVWLIVASAFAHAHTTLETTVPASESVLATSPSVIELRFEHSTQLTSVIVQAQGQSPRKLRFEPLGSAFDFQVLRPGLSPGRNEIEWKGLSADGHVIEGKLVFVVDPTVQKRD